MYLPYPTLLDKIEFGFSCIGGALLVALVLVVGASWIRRRARPIHNWGEDEHA